MRLLIDGNSLLNAALLRGVDHDDGYKVKDDDGKDVQINGHQYGVDNFFDKIKDALEHFGVAPRQCVLTWDGRNAKVRRRTFLERYKEGRDKHPAVNEQLNIARERCTKMMLDLGGTVVHQDGMEADDVLGYLAKSMRVQRNVVITSDGDLSVLVDENTDVWRLGELNKNPYGPFPHKYITLYKALVGDTGDKIPGAKGFGDAKFVDLVRIFGLEGLEVMQELIENDQLDRLKEDLDDFPALKFIIDDKQGVTTSWRVARLHIDDVNTVRRPMVIQAGMVKQWTALADEDRVHDLREFYGTKTLVHAGNYEAVLERFKKAVHLSPFVALDIETSSSDESDEWTAKVQAVSDDKERNRDKVDVLGAVLAGMGLTFGDNTQHTIYAAVDHLETEKVKNISQDQCRELCEQIPHKRIQTVIQNRAFEFPVLYLAWGDKWKDNGWAGFVPNAVDTIAAGSYANENLPAGLKERSKAILGYEQQTYDEVTTLEGEPGTLPPGGRLVKVKQLVLEPAVFREEPAPRLKAGVRQVLVTPAVTKDIELRQYKMNELTAEHVLNYGADDPICTAALYSHYQFIMELENTWHIYQEVEQKPEYLTSLAYVKGIPISLEKLTGMEKADNERYDKSWATLRAFLMKSGWAGSTCPVFEELTNANVKEAVGIIVPGGENFDTKKHKLVALAHDLREQFPDEQSAMLLAEMVERNQVDEINRQLKAHFTGEPVINFDSPKQMQRLFYEVIGITPRILNKLTDNQRADEKYRKAWKTWRKIKDGKDIVPTDEERALWISKASTDDTAVLVALARDKQLTEEQREVLDAFKSVKSVMTRRKLFYKSYKVLPHWRDGRIHPSLNQCRAVTRRYSASNPNVQQLPKRGEGVEFRKIVLPHRKGAVVVAPDLAGQELRLMAEQSGDKALTACYVGDNLRDVHSLTAVAAAPLMWNEPVTYERFQEMRALPKADPLYLKAKTLREDAKTTNFATQYDAQAERVSQELLCDEETAQQFIDAKDKAFPDVGPWKEMVRERVEATGFAVTLMGARRHLRDVLLSENRWEAAKAGRQGPNFEIQGSAAEQTKLAMCRTWDTGVFWDGRYDAVFYMPVHDELVFSVAVEDALPVIKAVHGAMTMPYSTMKIPVVSSISLGSTYGDQIETGDFYDEDAIRGALTVAYPTREIPA